MTHYIGSQLVNPQTFPSMDQLERIQFCDSIADGLERGLTDDERQRLIADFREMASVAVGEPGESGRLEPSDDPLLRFSNAELIETLDDRGCVVVEYNERFNETDWSDDQDAAVVAAKKAGFKVVPIDENEGESQ